MTRARRVVGASISSHAYEISINLTIPNYYNFFPIGLPFLTLIVNLLYRSIDNRKNNSTRPNHDLTRQITM